MAYIEKSFTDTKSKSGAAVMDKVSTSNGIKTSRPKAEKRTLSSPRPRRSKEIIKDALPINAEMEQLWSHLPKIVTFLQSNYDDAVTSNYYRGDFKESREELIERLLDPELSLEEVSRLLGVCPATVRRYTNRDWLGHHRTKGGQRRFRLSGVAKFVEEHGRDIR